jgi:hypothetical protein
VRRCGLCGSQVEGVPIDAARGPAALPPKETLAMAAVTREQLWRIARLARVFHRRVTNGRWDARLFQTASEHLEVAIDALPEKVWTER